MSQCNKYNCLPRNMLNHAGNSYIPRWKQLCHPPDTVISGSRSNGAVAKQSKQSSGIWKQNLESTSSVFHFIWLCFYFKMSHNIYHMYVFSGGYTRISAPRWHESPAWRVMSSDVEGRTRQCFRVTSGLVFWYITLEALWYMHNSLIGKEVMTQRKNTSNEGVYLFIHIFRISLNSRI